MLRLAIVGCGNHSRKEHAAPLARYIAEHPGQVQLAAACDLDLNKARTFRDAFGFADVYEQLDPMLDAVKPDVCLCIMPVDRVAAVSSHLLQRGVTCVIEKPPGTSRQQVRQLAQTTAQTGTPHMVSVNRRFQPHLNQALAWAKQRSPIRHMRAAVLRVGRTEPDFIWATGIHIIDALRYIAGEVRTFDVQTMPGDELTGRWYAATLQFAGGCAAQLSLLTTTGVQEETFELAGQGFFARTTLNVVTGRSALQCWADGALQLHDESRDDLPRDMTNGSYHECVALIEALQGKRTMGPTMQDVLPSMELCFDLAEATTPAR